MSADLAGAARAYMAFYQTISPQTVEEIRALVAADVHFKDPFNDVRGADRLVRLLQKMFEDATDVRFELVDQALSGSLCFVRWRFFFRPRRFAGGAAWPVDGVSAIRFDQQGRVVEHIDYWDAAGQIYERLPLIGRVLRALRDRLGMRA